MNRHFKVLSFLYTLTLLATPANATTDSGTAEKQDDSSHSSFAITINDSFKDQQPTAEQTEPGSESQADELSDNPATVAGKSHALSGWSLPITGPLTLVKKTIAIRRLKEKEEASPENLSGTISFSDPYETISSHIDELLETALERDPRSKMFDEKVGHYNKKVQKVIAESKDATNYVIPFRGFGPSIEAGNAILDENVQLKSKASAEYARQKHVDEMHLKVVSSMMQIAMGLGMEDKTRADEVTTSGITSLKELVGEEAAQKAKQRLVDMVANINVPDELYGKATWDVQGKQAKHRELMELSLEDDQVVHQIKKHIHKYNQRSKFARVSSSVVQTLLGAASLTPTFVGPAAKTALLAFVMATGGPEQCKLMKELYLDKRLESRWKVLNEEAHMALDNYQLALLTRNPVLLGYSESLVGQMIGGHNVKKVFGRQLIAESTAGTADSAPAESSAGVL